jgi:hypothetical protein
MNAQTALIIAASMHSVQTLLVHSTVNVNLGFLEMEFPVQVRQVNFIASLVIFLFYDQYLLFLDIDECSTNPCGLNAACADKEGSFDCQCNAGFSGDGFSCTGNQASCLQLKYLFGAKN